MKIHPLACRVTLALVLAACSRSAPSSGTEKPAGLPPTPGAAPLPPPAQTPPPAAPSGGEAEMVPAAPEVGQTIAGTIVLPAARKGDVKKGDTIFLIARRTGGAAGPGSMLAVQRLQAGDFPMPFALSSRDAMIPGTPFTGDISISVRVDKDGDPITRRKGDLLGEATGVHVGAQDVKIALDTVQKEDVTLQGPMGGGALPPGHPGGALPPGHP
jgi:hypothetical protein